MKSKTKTKIAALAVATLVLFSSCHKQTATPVIPVPQTTTNNYGVSVESGRLKFESLQKFETVMGFNDQDRKKFMAYIAKLEGFTSRKEKMEMIQYTSRTTSECNCDLDDDYASSLVDEHFMMDIDDWTIRLNGCDNNFYAQYKEGLTADQLSERLTSMINCNFDASKNFFVITKDYELSEELAINEQVIHNQVPQARCHDNACSDRLDVAWEDTYLVYTPHYATIPEFRLYYHKGWFNGTINIFGKDYGNNNFFQNQWFIDLQDSHFREKCGDAHDLSASAGLLFTDHGNWNGGPWWSREFYSGKRLKAGEGQIILNMHHRKDKQDADQNFYYETALMSLTF